MKDIKEEALKDVTEAIILAKVNAKVIIIATGYQTQENVYAKEIGINVFNLCEVQGTTI